MQTERVGVLWKSHKLTFATCLSRISTKSTTSLLASLSFFVVLLNCTRQLRGYNRFVPNHFLSIVLNPFKDEKSESTYLYNAPWFPRKHCFLEGSQASYICPSAKRSKLVWSTCGTVLTGKNQSTWFKNEVTLVCISRWMSYCAVNSFCLGYSNQ